MKHFGLMHYVRKRPITKAVALRAMRMHGATEEKIKWAESNLPDEGIDRTWFRYWEPRRPDEPMVILTGTAGYEHLQKVFKDFYGKGT